MMHVFSSDGAMASLASRLRRWRYRRSTRSSIESHHPNHSRRSWMLNQVLSLLRRTRFNLTSESQLQQEISQVFATQNLTINREVRLSERDRPDFMVDGIAIEV